MFAKREFAFGHIPSAISVPLGELDSAVLDKMKQIYVICRTGNRSDVAHVERERLCKCEKCHPRHVRERECGKIKFLNKNIPTG